MINTKDKKAVYFTAEKELKHKLRDMPYCPIISNLSRNIFVRYFSEYEHAIDFLDKGTIKFNKFSTLRKIESKREDSIEGEHPFIYTDEKSFTERYKHKYLNIENDDLNVFCITYIDLGEYLQKSIHDCIVENMVDSREKYAVVVNEIDTFLNQVRKEFTLLKFSKMEGMYEERFIEYKSNKESLFVNKKNIEDEIFTKNIKYSNENEFRIVNNHSFNDVNNPLQLVNCGAIDKYSFIIDLESNEVFTSINSTFMYMVEYCVLHSITDFQELNKHLSKSAIIIGRKMKKDTKETLKALGIHVDAKTDYSILEQPFKVTKQKFDNYIKPYLKKLDFLMTIIENTK